MQIKLTAIDSGYNTGTVYSWCREFAQTRRVIPVKGRDSLDMIFSRPQAVDVSYRGKTIRGGLKVFSVGVSVAKQELYGWLRQPRAVDGEPDLPGFCHFPQYEAEHFKQLTAEQMQSKLLRGYKKTEWVKTRERNEALDCRVYARAAAAVLGIDRMTDEHWAKFYATTEHARPIEKDKKPQQRQEKPRVKFVQREGDWL